LLVLHHSFGYSAVFWHWRTEAQCPRWFVRMPSVYYPVFSMSSPTPYVVDATSPIKTISFPASVFCTYVSWVMFWICFLCGVVKPSASRWSCAGAMVLTKNNVAFPQDLVLASRRLLGWLKIAFFKAPGRCGRSRLL